MVGMILVRVFLDYSLWHYSSAYRQIFSVWRNYLWYVNKMFSVTLLLRTLLSPWKRMTEVYQGSFDIGRLFEVILMNLMSRFVGLIIRIPLIICGVLLSALMGAGLVVFYVYWTVFPVLVLALGWMSFWLLYG